MSGVMKDLTGLTFGRLSVIRLGIKQGVNYHWVCQCECGNTTSVRGSALRSGESLSCGCLRKERATEANTTHGKSRDGAYSSWHCMMNRCYDKAHDQYARYGEKGITVCDRWHSFELFFSDMGSRPEGMTIDRKDSTGNYELNNCRWATKKEQANNRKSSKLIEFNGRAMNTRDWGKELGIPWQTIYSRLRCGWTVERALTT